MIINHIFTTGLNSSLTGSSGNSLEYNLSSDYYDGSFFVNGRTGLNNIIASLNGLTLLERTSSGFSTPYGFEYSGSGDVFSKTGVSYAQVFINDSGVANYSEKKIIFDIRSEVECPMGVGSTGLMQSGLMSDISGKLPAYTGSNLIYLDYFLNGQKIYSGLNSGIGSYLISGNSFLYLENITGKLFAMPKKTGINDITGSLYDIDSSSNPFIEGNSNLYINGAECPSECWMESNIRVTGMVEPSLQARISNPTIDYKFVSL